jgi:hypothetical protein
MVVLLGAGRGTPAERAAEIHRILLAHLGSAAVRQGLGRFVDQEITQILLVKRDRRPELLVAIVADADGTYFTAAPY